MKALILAAGLGTRLRPITNHTPKALVQVGGRTMLDRSVEQLEKVGIREIAINTCYLAKKIEEYVDDRLKKLYPEISFEVIREPELLETGGGLKNAEYFLKDSDPFLIHNSDVVHNIDLGLMVEEFKKEKPLAILACAKQETTRPFLVDEEGNVCGHKNKIINEETLVKEPLGRLKEMRFCGIHLISNKIFDYLNSGKYSITPKYLELIGNGEKIRVFDVGEAFYADIGTEERIKEVENIINMSEDSYGDSYSQIGTVVLAAGKGTRMNSNKPKVLHTVGDKPLVFFILEKIKQIIGTMNIRVVVGYKHDEIVESLGDKYLYAMQKSQKGTAHALKQGLIELPVKVNQVLVFNGDDSLFFTIPTIKSSLEYHLKNNKKFTINIAKFNLDEAPYLGGLKRDRQKQPVGIYWTNTQAREDGQKILEVFTGFYIIDKG